MQYTLEWNPARRAFKGFSGDNDTLLVLNVDHQVQDLTSTGCSITFGAEFATPRLNVSDLVAGRLNLGGGIASALVGVVDVDALVGGVENLDRLVTDRVARLIDAPVDAALDPVAAALVADLSNRYALAGDSFAFCTPGALNSIAPLQNALSGMLAGGAPLFTELDTALADAITGCDTALQLVGTPASREKIATAVQQLGALAGQAHGRRLRAARQGGGCARRGAAHAHRGARRARIPTRGTRRRGRIGRRAAGGSRAVGTRLAARARRGLRAFPQRARRTGRLFRRAHTGGTASGFEARVERRAVRRRAGAAAPDRPARPLRRPARTVPCRARPRPRRGQPHPQQGRRRPDRQPSHSARRRH